MTDERYQMLCYTFFGSGQPSEAELASFRKLDVLRQIDMYLVFDDMCNSPHMSIEAGIMLRAMYEIERLRDEEARRNI